MKRKLTALFICIAFAIALVALAQSEIIVLDYGSKMFKPAQFPHKHHAEELKLGCSICHHKGENTKCGICHTANGEEDVPKAKVAFHKQCKACHQKMRSEGKNSPIACTGCHEKK